MTKPKGIFQRAARETPQPGARYLTSNAVCLRYHVSELSVRRWVRDPRINFPQPFQVAPHGVNFWHQAELDAYDERRMAAAMEQVRARPQLKTPLTAASTGDEAAHAALPADQLERPPGVTN